MFCLLPVGCLLLFLTRHITHVPHSKQAMSNAGVAVPEGTEEAMQMPPAQDGAVENPVFVMDLRLFHVLNLSEDTRIVQALEAEVGAQTEAAATYTTACCPGGP